MLAAALFFFSAPNVSAQKEKLKKEIEKIVSETHAEVGAAIVDIENNFSLAVNNDRRYPMQSVFKFPLALAILDEVDKGTLQLDQKINVTKKDLLPNTWSPLREKFPDGAEITLGDLIGYTVAQSDNNGCDILFRLLGGTDAVDKYVRRIGVKDIAIAATEEAMAKSWEVQFTNWNKPLSMARLLKNFYNGKIVSQSSRDFLWKVMTETSTGTKRIKGLLPPDTIVGHKTGTSGTNDAGITAATNDAGIVTLPNGKHFAIVVYVANSEDNTETRDAIIARIAKAVWDDFKRS